MLNVKMLMNMPKNKIHFMIPNQMLYGIDSYMATTGVSNGKCDKVNPLIYTERYKCGSDTAG
jgi:hypothetical protein